MGRFKRMSQEEWDRRRNTTHGDKYHCLDKYQGNKVKIRFVCKDHGVFEQTPNNHLRGNGCPVCFNEDRRVMQEDFDRRRVAIHGDRYECLDTYPKNNSTKIRFKCSEHGVFEQTPMAHLQGQGCRKCAYKQRALDRKLSEEEWNRRRKEVHGDRYDCLDTYVNDYTKLRFVCPEHGEFMMAPMSHMRQGQGCPGCSESKGERKINEVLKELGLTYNVDYFREYRFDDCRNKRTLPFDFFVPTLNLLIEYDGVQHFMSAEVFGGNVGLEERQKNDKIKNDYCTRNNLKLVRIPYTHYDQIGTILEFVLEDLKLAA